MLVCFSQSTTVLAYSSCLQCSCFSDVDECAMNSTLCDQMCENTFGSYMCTCHIGFRLNNISNQCEGIPLTISYISSNDLTKHYRWNVLRLVYLIKCQAHKQ